jgi:hypothetical protein
MRYVVLFISLSLLAGCAGLGPAPRLPLAQAPVEPGPVEEASAGVEVELPAPGRHVEPGPALEVLREELVVAEALVGELDTGQLAQAPSALRAVRAGALQVLPALARRVLERSAQLVGVSSLRRVDRSVNDDCVGFLQLAYKPTGIDLVRDSYRDGENAVSAIFRNAQRRGALHRQTPRPGDIVFFRETYDRNRDGQRNDGMTHVGVVEQVDADGTITFIHRGKRGIARSRMNLERPTTKRVGNAVVNDILRPAKGKERAYLTSELFAAFASPEAL